MNFEKIGFALCKIVSKDKKIKDVNIYFATHGDKGKINYPIESIELDDESMQHMPYTMKDEGTTRQILYVSGASGSGKSYYASSYIKEYVKISPKNDVFVVSSVDKDKQLDSIKNVKELKWMRNFVIQVLVLMILKIQWLYMMILKQLQIKWFKKKLLIL